MRLGNSSGILGQTDVAAPRFVLVLDTCAECASLALFQERILLEERVLGERTASSSLLGALREMLTAQNISGQDFSVVGVVRGPGSFTGVRVGLALAKGLCEASGTPLVGVSRLEVLADAASLTEGFALLEAGREQMYVRAQNSKTAASEWLTSLDEIRPMLEGAVVAITSAALATRLRTDIQFANTELRIVSLTAKDALGPVLQGLAQGETSWVEVDANYVRNEETIYARQRAGASDVVRS